jgi:hypothetical protein
MTIRLPLLAVVALIAASLLTPELRAAKPAPDVPVVAVLADSSNGVPLRVSSDGLGAYAPSSQLSSVVQPRPTGADWLMTTYYMKRGSLTWTRRVMFDLTEQETAGAFPTPIAAPTVLAAHLKVGCSNAGVDMLRLTAGQTVSCPGSFRFLAPDGRWYRLGFNDGNYPGVDPLAVTCTSASVAGCTVWTANPSGPPTGTDPNPKSRAQLLEIDNSGNVLALGGTYFVSFSITLARS